MTEDNAPLKPKFPRQKPTAPRVAAQRTLLEEMEHAAELLHSEEDFERSGVLHAIRACHGFLRVRGLSGQGLKPLMDLIAAFESVQKGTLPELFDPKMAAGEETERKWSRSPAAGETKIHAAACMEVLMNNGQEKQNAAARVARSATTWPRISCGMIEAITVINWRDELKQQGSDNPDRQKFEALSKMFSKGPKAKAHLKEVLRIGPFMTGGMRNSPKT